MTRRIKSILFDLDGVLVDACDWHYEALNMALKEVCNYCIPYEEHVMYFNALPTKKKLEILVDRNEIKLEDSLKVWSLKQKFTEIAINEYASVDPEKLKLHQWLCDMGIKTACVTNSIKSSALLMLEKTGQLSFLKYIISNEDIENPKPNSEGYVTAMVKLKSLPFETLIVEDSDKGYAAAINTGANVLRVKNATEVTYERIRSQL